MIYICLIFNNNFIPGIKWYFCTGVVNPISLAELSLCINLFHPSRQETTCTSSATDWRGKKHENKNNQNTMKYHDCIEKALRSPSLSVNYDISKNSYMYSQITYPLMILHHIYMASIWSVFIYAVIQNE